jgi:hypothetical protein
MPPQQTNLHRGPARDAAGLGVDLARLSGGRRSKRCFGRSLRGCLHQQRAETSARKRKRLDPGRCDAERLELCSRDTGVRSGNGAKPRLVRLE